MAQIIPLGKRVLIKQDPLPEKKIGSIYLPDDNSETKYPTKGTVLELGPKVKSVKKGDRVFFGDWSYYVLDREKNLIVLDEDHLLLEEH